MWLKKLKKKKAQFLLISLILCFTTAILSGCIAFTVETNISTDKCFSCERCPMCFRVLIGAADESILTGDENAMKYISDIEVTDARMIEGNIYRGDECLMNDQNIFYRLDDINSLKYTMNIIEGDKSAVSPSDGEVWVCTVFAENNSIKLGQELCLGKNGKALKVTGVITTPVCPSGFMDTYPFLVNASTLDSLDGTVMTSINIYVKSNDITPAMLFDSLPTDFNERSIMNIKKSSMLLCVTMLSSIMGGVGIISALVIFAVSLVIVGFIIKSTLNREFKQIGIYKALGWKSRDIVGFYLRAYLAAGTVGIIPGAFLGVPFAYCLGSINLKSLACFELSGTTAIICVLTAVFFILVLTLNVFSSLKRIRKITPVQAISMGMASSKEKLNRSFIKNASSSFSMAINDIVKKRGMSLLLALVLSLSFYLCVLFTAANITLADYKYDAVHWLGMPDTDCCISICNNEAEKIDEYLAGSDMVEKHLFTDLNANKTGVSSATNPEIDFTEAHILVFSEISKELTDTICVDGRIASNAEEIAISKTFQNKTGLGVGDYLELHTDNGGCTFLIVGVYSTMLQGGNGIEMSAENYRRLGFTPNYSYAMIYLADGVKMDELRADFDRRGYKSDVLKNFSFMQSEGDTVNSVAGPVTIILIIIFVLFSVLNIINLMLTNNIENRKKYGILKAMGFTNGYICRQNIFKMTLLSLVAVAFTLVLHKLLSPLVFTIAAGMTYIKDTPLIDILVPAILFALVLFTTLMFTIPLRKISPKDLMEE